MRRDRRHGETLLDSDRYSTVHRYSNHAVPRLCSLLQSTTLTCNDGANLNLALHTTALIALTSAVTVGGGRERVIKTWVNPFVPSLKVWGIYSILDRVTMLSSIRQASDIESSIDLYLHPPTDGVGTFDAREFDQLIDGGYEYALPMIRAWKHAVDAGSALTPRPEQQ
jgi:hypothetical protein